MAVRNCQALFGKVFVGRDGVIRSMSNRNTPEGLPPGEEFFHADSALDLRDVLPLRSILRNRGRPEVLADNDVFEYFAGDHRQGGMSEGPLRRVVRAAGAVVKRVF